MPGPMGGRLMVNGTEVLLFIITEVPKAYGPIGPFERTET